MRRLNRAAHSLIPPFRFMNLSSGSEGHLYVAIPNARAHFERVRLAIFAPPTFSFVERSIQKYEGIPSSFVIVLIRVIGRNLVVRATVT